MSEAAITCHLISKSFHKHQALDQVTFQVHRGDFCAFIGPNGAGKSTTIRILLGLLSAQQGQASLLGHTCGPNRSDLMHRVGYLPSEAPLYKNIRVGELLNLSSSLQNKDCRKEQERLIQLFDLNPQAKIDQLSLGNRKKIAIITALQHKPELYILDEPTSGLDPVMQERFWQEMVNRHQAGATIFTSSHDLAEVQKYCQRVILIRQGKIIFENHMSRLLSDHYKLIHLKGRLIHQNLIGMKDYLDQESSISFRYQGEIEPLLDYLQNAGQELTDLTISNPNLDQVLHHYYQINQEG